MPPKKPRTGANGGEVIRDKEESAMNCLFHCPHYGGNSHRKIRIVSTQEQSAQMSVKCAVGAAYASFTGLHSNNCECLWQSWARGCGRLRGQEDGCEEGGKPMENETSKTPQGVWQSHRCATLSPTHPSYGAKISWRRSRSWLADTIIMPHLPSDHSPACLNLPWQTALVLHVIRSPQNRWRAEVFKFPV